MDDTPTTALGTSPAEAPDAELPSTRACTRCDGQQHLLAEQHGLGKYRCDVCEMAVGFDLDSDEPEFLIHRGLPSRYTNDLFGDRLLEQERRLERRPAQFAVQE